MQISEKVGSPPPDRWHRQSGREDGRRKTEDGRRKTEDGSMDLIISGLRTSDSGLYISHNGIVIIYPLLNTLLIAFNLNFNIFAYLMLNLTIVWEKYY